MVNLSTVAIGALVMTVILLLVKNRSLTSEITSYSRTYDTSKKSMMEEKLRMEANYQQLKQQAARTEQNLRDADAKFKTLTNANQKLVDDLKRSDEQLKKKTEELEQNNEKCKKQEEDLTAAKGNLEKSNIIIKNYQSKYMNLLDEYKLAMNSLKDKKDLLNKLKELNMGGGTAATGGGGGGEPKGEETRSITEEKKNPEQSPVKEPEQKQQQENKDQPKTAEGKEDPKQKQSEGEEEMGDAKAIDKGKEGPKQLRKEDLQEEEAKEGEGGE